MQIMIATPTYGGVGAEYVASTLRLQRYLMERGIGTTSAHHAMAEVSRSRNLLARLFLDQSDATHLLFIDSDMSFAPQVVDALIDARKGVVGCIYPRRSLDLDRVIAAAKAGAPRERAIAAGMDFVIKPLGASIEVEHGLARVRGVGMGLCLIARPVLEALAATGELKADPDLSAGRPHAGPVHGFFDPLPTPNGFLAEDLSFCERWITLCGGDVWAVVDQTVGHVGSMVYEARFSDVLYEV